MHTCLVKIPNVMAKEVLTISQTPTNILKMPDIYIEMDAPTHNYIYIQNIGILLLA